MMKDHRGSSLFCLCLLIVGVLQLALITRAFNIKKLSEQELLEKYSRLIENNDKPLPASFKDKVADFMKSHGASDQSQLADQFQELGQELEEVTQSDDLEENLRAAKRLLETKESAPEDARAFKQVAQFFLSLGELESPDSQCNERAETILRLNDHLTIYRASDLDLRDNEIGRADLMVRKAMLRHAQKCSTIYEQRYKSIVENELSEPTRFELTKGALGDESIAYFLASDPSHLINLISGELVDTSEEWEQTKDKVIGALGRSLRSRIGRAERESKDGDEFNRSTAFDEFLKKPCEEYNQKLGSKVFSPASLDVANDFKAKMQADRQMSADEINFALGLARYEICSSLFRYEQAFREGISKKLTQSY